MKYRAWVILLLLQMTQLRANAFDPVPPERLPYGGTWEGIVGVSGGIPNRTTVYTTLPVSATLAQVQNAISACPSNQVVQLTNGTYNLNGTIVFPVGGSGITLRGKVDGNGKPTTVLYNAQLQVANGWDASAPSGFTTVNVNSGATRGSTSLVLASAPSIAVGQVMVLSAPKGPIIQGGSYALWFGSRPFTQYLKVTAKSGATVSFTPAINADYLPSSGLEVSWKTMSYQCGIEDLAITNVNDRAIYFNGADECWVKNVIVDGPAGSADGQFVIYCSRRAEVRHSQFVNAGNFASSVSNLRTVDSDGLLIEDNVFRNSAICHLFGQSGSVWAYNFFDHMPYYGTDNPAWLTQTLFFHGCHSHYNLFEGNWVANHYHDGLINNSDEPTDCRNNVFFRERNLGFDACGGTLPDPCAASTPKTDNLHCFTSSASNINWVVAGCVMGKPGVAVNYAQTPSVWANADPPCIFNVDIRGWTNMFRRLNWNTVDNGVHSGESLSSNEVLAVSYVHSVEPTWFGNRPWPPFNAASSPSVSTNMANLPAAYRYLNGVEPPAGVAGTPPSPPSGLTVH